VRAHRLWVASELYYPETTSTGYFLTGIAEGLAEQFHVSVLCSQPTYSARGTVAPRRERRGEVSIQRCAGTRFDKDHLPLRLVNAVTITAAICWAAFVRVRRGDLVLVVTNPPTLPFGIALACRLRGARFLLLIHDVYPELAVASGMARPESALVRAVAWATRRLYRAAGRTIVLGRDMQALVRRKLGDAPDTTVIIPNWGDVVGIEPRPASSSLLRARVAAAGDFVVQFMGNMGRSHGVETVVEAATRAASDSNLRFLFVGWGGRRRWLEEAVAERGLRQVTVLPPCSMAELPDYLAAADIAIIPFLPGMTGISVPSRMYNVMAAGRPILAVAEPDSELARVILEERIGWIVPPSNPEALLLAIVEARSDPDRLRQMGARARAAAERSYSLGRVKIAYQDLVREVWSAAG